MKGSRGLASKIDVVLGEVFTASVTPFDARRRRVNLPKFRELASYLVENGSDGLVVTGTTGESPTLTDDERFDALCSRRSRPSVTARR